MWSETIVRSLGVCLLLLWMGLCMGRVRAKEDIFKTPCNEANVTLKYSLCLAAEREVFSTRRFLSEVECRQKYRNIANCIKQLGDVCDNGETANYKRFQYHEYNIIQAGIYVCKNLYELRSAVHCVSRKHWDIRNCILRIMWSLRMRTFQARATKQQRFCGNMGVAVHCRQQSARQCKYNHIYFGYLFTVYPIECQQLPWVNKKTTRAPEPETPCTLNNFVSKFNKCFNLNHIVFDSSINTTATCRRKFQKFRTCTDRLYESCLYVNPLAKVVKQYAAPEKMELIEKFACKNLDEVRQGAKCVNMFENLIKGCIETKQKYQSDLIQFIKKTDPERAACLVIDVEYRCRNAFKYKCQNETAYFHYLDLLYPKCEPATKPTKAPTQRCSLKNYDQLYMRCMAKANSIILAVSSTKGCKSRFYDLSVCLTNLHTNCKGTDAEKVARAMADPVTLDKQSTDFVCKKLRDLRFPVYCLMTYKKDVADCVAKNRQYYKGVCHTISLVTKCEGDVLIRHACNNTNVYFEYKRMLLPSNCSALPTPKPNEDVACFIVRAQCTLETLHEDIIGCLRIQATIMDDVRLTDQQCPITFAAARQCYLQAGKLCRGTLSEKFDAIFTQDTFDDLRKYGCSNLIDLKRIASCLLARLNGNCTKIPTNARSFMMNNKIVGYDRYFCRLATRVVSCYRSNLAACDERDVFKRYLDAVIPKPCYSLRSITTTMQPTATTGAASPRIGAASPTTGAASPRTGAASPTTGAASPTTGAASPTTGATSPRTGAASPASIMSPHIYTVIGIAVIGKTLTSLNHAI